MAKMMKKTNVIIQIIDSDGRKVAQDRVETSEDGSYRSTLPLNEKAGTYNVQIYPDTFIGFRDRIVLPVYSISDETIQELEE